MKPLKRWQVVAVILLAGYGTRVHWLPTLVEPDEITATVDLPEFYGAWAEILRRDASALITTTEKFRSAHIASAKLLVSGTDYERVDGRDQAISDKIAAAIGLEDRPFTEDLRVKLAGALEAIGDSL
jgi:hypothetical protein